MEKFMYLFRGGENHAHNQKESKAAQDNMQAWMMWMKGMQEKGILVQYYLLALHVRTHLPQCLFDQDHDPLCKFFHELF